jgi:putative FmdB family regulatory protein
MAMPIYAYQCDACGHAKDVLQKISDEPLSDCPACGAVGAFKKQVTAAGFQLKGSGWYVTDFRGNGQAPAKKADSDASGAADSKAAGSGDSAKADGAKPDSGKSDGGAASKTESAPSPATAPAAAPAAAAPSSASASGTA